MTTAHDIDLPSVLVDRLTTTHPDVLRELLATFLHTLMGAEADVRRDIQPKPGEAVWVFRCVHCLVELLDHYEVR